MKSLAVSFLCALTIAGVASVANAAATESEADCKDCFLVLNPQGDQYYWACIIAESGEGYNGCSDAGPNGNSCSPAPYARCCVHTGCSLAYFTPAGSAVTVAQDISADDDAALGATAFSALASGGPLSIPRAEEVNCKGIILVAAVAMESPFVAPNANAEISLTI